MSKRLVAKLTLAVAALCAMTLLQGCSKEVDSTVLSKAWMPFSAAPATNQTTTATGG